MGSFLFAGGKNGMDYSVIQKSIETLVYIIGGAIAMVGVIDALSGYSNQSSGKMSEGIIKAVGGVGIIVIGATLVPSLFNGLG